MESLLITTKVIDNHRIKIYYDDCAFCPCTDWDLAALYLFEYNDRYHHNLHKECNWEEIWGKHVSNNHPLDDSLKELIQEHCDFDDVLNYIKKGKLESVHLEYDKKDKMWKLSILGHRIFDVKSGWHVITEFDADERRNKWWDNVFGNLFEALDTELLTQIISDCGKDIFIKEWETRGYSQGEYVSGIAYCTKERYVKMVSEDTKDWKNKLDSIVDSEVEVIGMWMWGDVKGFRLEKKVEFTKTYEDGRTEEDFEWEEVGDCWGYFMETEELIQEVISEYNLKEDAA